jgi:hypothetical protein
MSKGNPRRIQRQNRTRERVAVTKFKWHAVDGTHARCAPGPLVLVKILHTTEAIFSTHDARARSKSKRRRSRKERRTQGEAV